MKFGSLFAGIGGFDLAFERAGMACAWQAEIDDKCNQILAHHWPDVSRYGDVRNAGKHNLKAVDLICGGFPCQDLSVAGKRAGLAGERSGLWFEFARIIEELKPRWVVIENVPGLLSSGEKRDMGILLGQLAEFGYMGANRVLDAQFFGVAQRRRRVFIVGYLGDGRATEVLFESTSGAWNPAPSREAGARVAGTVIKGAAIGRKPETGLQWGEFLDDGSCYTLNATEQHAIAYTIQTNDGGNHKRKDRPQGGMYVSEADAALTVGSSDQTVIVPQDVAATLNSGGNSGGFRTEPGEHIVAFDWQQDANYSEEVTATLSVTRTQAVSLRQGVRRLTPVECERLQGFPDNWTAVNGMSDSARYRQLGNAVAVPVVEWIGKRIIQQEQHQ